MKLSKTKLLKITIISSITLVLLTIITASLVVYFFPKKQLLDIITKSIKEEIHREIKIEELNYGFGGVSLSNIEITQKEKDKPLIKAKKISVGFSLLSLLDKEFKINSISITDCSINIVFKDGKLNIDDLINQKNSNKSNSNSKIKTKISKIYINNLSLNFKNPPEDLSILNQKFVITTTVNILDKKHIKLTNCTLNANGGTIKPKIMIDLSEKTPLITGSVEVKNFSLLPLYKWQKVNSLPFETVNGSIEKIRIKDLVITASGTANSSMRTTKNRLYVVGGVVVDKNNNNVYLKSIKGKIGETSAFVKFLHFNITGTLFSLETTDAKVRVKDINSIIQIFPKKLYGKAQGKVKMYNSKLTAELKLIDVGYDKKQNLLSSVNTSISIKENEFKKENIKAKLLGNNSIISAATLDSNLKKIYLDIKSNSFSLNEFLFKKDKKIKSKTVKSKSKYLIDPKAIKEIPIMINGKVYLKTMTLDKFKFKKIQLKYSISNGKLNINNFTGNIFGGKVFGKSKFISTKGPIKCSANLNLANIKIQNFAIIKNSFKDRFFGILNAKARLNFSLLNNFHNKTNGVVQFSIDKGKVANTGIQNGLGIWLTDLKYKLKDLEFNKIYGKVKIKGSNLKIDNFVFNSKDIRLRVKGIFNNKLIATTPVFLDLEFSKHFIQDLPSPVFVGLAPYKKGSWYSIPFSTTGNIRSAKNLKRLK